MVRFFIHDGGGGSKILFSEVQIPAVTANATNPSFTHELLAGGSFALQCDNEIWASTENAEEFGITIAGSDWENIP